MRIPNRWPGQFVGDVAERLREITPRSVLLSPVLWLTAVLSYAILFPWVGSMVHWTDSGELIASAVTLGVPHPTGYPLLSLLARSLLSIVPWADPVSLLHHLSAIFVALSSGFVSLLTILIGADIGRRKDQDALLSSGLIAGLFFTTSLTMWSQAVSYEVYGFQALLYALIVLSVVLSVREMDEGSGISRWWIFAGLLMGFGFANHMMTLYVLPGLGWYVWRHLGFPSRTLIGVLGASMLVGLSVYAYLFIRAGSSPPLNWGDPETVDALIAHVTGKQYRVWMFSGLDAFKRSASLFFSAFPRDVGVGVLICAVVGSGVVWARQRRLAILLLILFLFTIVYALNYDIHDIETYFILAILVVSIVSGFGARTIASLVAGNSRMALFGIPLIVLLLNLSYRYPAFSRADEESPEPFARYVLEQAGPNASILTGRWDFLYSPILALQHVYGLRTDVQVIDIHLLRDRSWYVEALREDLAPMDPELERAAGSFLTELRKFERNEPFSVQVIQRRWVEYLRSLLGSLARRGPVLVDHEIARDLPPVFKYAPDGYLLRAFPGQESVPVEGEIPEYYPIGSRNDEFAQSYKRFCATAFLNHAVMSFSGGDSSAARQAVELARSIDPRNPLLAQFP